MNLSILRPFNGSVPEYVLEAISALDGAQEWGEATNYEFYPFAHAIDIDLSFVAIHDPYDSKTWCIPIDRCSAMPYCQLVADIISDGNSLEATKLGNLFLRFDATREEMQRLSGYCHMAMG